jgi:hypothetical protein
MKHDPDAPIQTDHTATLEQAYIAEYLEQRGLTVESVHQLAEPEAHAVMRDASIYASAKLTEVESRARYVHDIHDASQRRP